MADWTGVILPYHVLFRGLDRNFTAPFVLHLDHCGAGMQGRLAIGLYNP